MIDEEETYKRFGYYSTDLKPKSSKKIVAVCDNCGKVREVKKGSYRDLCHSCSLKTEKYRKKQRKISTKRWENSEERKKLTEYWEDPKNREKQRKTQKKIWGDPDYKKKMSKILEKTWANPKLRKRQSESHIGKHLSAESCKKVSKAVEKSWRNPEIRKKRIEGLSKATKIRYEDPNERKKTSESIKKLYEDPEVHIKQSCRALGITREEWNGFSENDWRNWNKAIYINEPFPNCHRHHLTKTLVVCIPRELHKHIYHCLRTGKGMAEMNMLALQFVNGGL